MCNWSVIHGIKRKPHLSVVWNWYHFVAIAILHQPRPTDSADINTRLQLSDTSSIPPMHGGFLLVRRVSTNKHILIGLMDYSNTCMLHIYTYLPRKEWRQMITLQLLSSLEVVVYIPYLWSVFVLPNQHLPTIFQNSVVFHTTVLVTPIGCAVNLRPRYPRF